MTIKIYQRETVELATYRVREIVGGPYVTTGVEMTFTQGDVRPSGWAAATVVDSNCVGLLFGPGTDHPMVVGRCYPWFRFANSPELPVRRGEPFDIV